MSAVPNSTKLFHHHISTVNRRRLAARIRASSVSDRENQNSRREILTTLLAATTWTLGLQATPTALAQSWGTRSFLLERFFEPGLSPEDSVARIRQTAEGLHALREMLERMSWRYVLFYIRIKESYLSQDMKTVMTILPEWRRKSYVQAANALVDNLSEFDFYVRTPKVYESYVYYEKTLKSIDDLVAMLPA